MIGILALQGGFELHARRITELNEEWQLVKTPAELLSVDRMILPGGESSVFLKLATDELRAAICERVSGGLPTLATCAGVIFLARGVENPAQPSLGLLDIDVERNAYGRQVDSFVDPHLAWTPDGRAAIARLDERRTTMRENSASGDSLEGVFIRAPRITRVGPNVSVLARRDNEPVLVRDGNILGATFHPELSSETTVHRLFLDLPSIP